MLTRANHLAHHATGSVDALVLSDMRILNAMKYGNWTVVFSCAVLCMTSVYALSRDLAPFFATPAEEAATPEAFADEQFSYGLSSYSQELVMKDCFRLVTTYTDFDLLEDAPRAIVAKCEQRAEDIVMRKPTDSFAWLVRAASASRLVDDAVFNQSLRMSQLTGPNEQWIAKYRVNMAEQQRRHMDQKTVAAEDADLRVLANSEKGVQLLAGQYVASPEFRERITSIVERLPPERQALFLHRIKRIRVING